MNRIEAGLIIPSGMEDYGLDGERAGGAEEGITHLLKRMRSGDTEAADDLFRTVYETLRRLARGAMRSQHPSHTLQPTALVNEAFLRLIRQDVEWRSRAHFLGVAARAMRSILVDHARAKRTRKRRDGRQRVPLDDVLVVFQERALELLALDEALERLAALDRRASRVVELRFFGGLSVGDVAEVMNIQTRVVERDWQYARAWLHAELQ